MQTFWALLLIGLLAWILASWFIGRHDPSWQLLVWTILVIFSKVYEGVVYPPAVYVGGMCALLLRFEFMGGWVRKVVRFIEAGAILLLLWQLFLVVRGY
jgi:hypothetical protein